MARRKYYQREKHCGRGHNMYISIYAKCALCLPIARKVQKRLFHWSNLDGDTVESLNVHTIHDYAAYVVLFWRIFFKSAPLAVNDSSNQLISFVFQLADNAFIVSTDKPCVIPSST